MSKILEFPNEARINEQAALWIARLDRELTATEQQSLHAWLQANTRHREALFEMAALWDRVGILNELSELFPLQSVPPRWRRALPVAATAALIIVTILTATWLAKPASRQLADTQTTLSAEYQTRVGEQRIVTLPDKSVVTLNTHTRLRVDYTHTDRLLALVEGEAHFAVAKGDPRIFTVRVGDNEFKAVGTAFNVRMNSSRNVALTVTEGRVKVLVAASEVQRPNLSTPQATQIMVDAGREVVINNATQTVATLPPAKLQATTAWTQGMIAFNGEPLEQIINEVSRYTEVQWVVSDDRIRQIPVSGYFKIGDIDALLAALHTNFDIEASSSDGKIILSAR